MDKTKLLLDVADSLLTLAAGVRAVAEALAVSEAASGVEPDRPATATEEQPAAKTITLEQVRAVLADKSRQGFTADVRALLAKYGAPKLSRIDPANYAALLAEAEELQ